MDIENQTDQRHRGIFGTALTSWFMLFVCLLAPEWTREGNKHCGVFYCCENFANCSVTDTEVVANPLPWVLAGWLLNFVGICSALCRCRKVHPENVRQMSVMSVVAGALTLTGSSQFIAQKFTSDFASVNFSVCGFLSHIAGWMLFISGACGFCHGYGYYSGGYEGNQRQINTQTRFGGANNEIYPSNEELMEIGRSRSPYVNVPPPDPQGNGQGSRLTRFRENFLPSNFARRFWRDAVVSSLEDQQNKRDMNT